MQLRHGLRKFLEIWRQYLLQIQVLKYISIEIITCIYTMYFIVGNRIEDFFYEKIDKKRPNRLSNLEYVGLDMIEAGNDFGPGIAYGM